MNPDGRVMSFLARLGDMFILNILYVVCCIPIITIGAATTALYYNTLKMAENRESYVWKEFLRTFKENFKQATVIWMIILVIGAVLVADFFVMGGIGSQALASVTAIVNCFRLLVENKVELAKPFAPLKLFHWKAVLFIFRDSGINGAVNMKFHFSRPSFNFCCPADFLLAYPAGKRYTLL